VHDSERVDLDDAVPRLKGPVFDRLSTGNTRIVDEDVQSSPGFCDLLRRSLEVLVTRHLEVDLERLPARCSNLLRGQSDALVVTPGDCYTPAVAAEEYSQRLTGTARRSGDQDPSCWVARVQRRDGA
jgi:hypothetical protein